MKRLTITLILIITLIVIIPVTSAWYDDDLLRMKEYSATADRDYNGITDDFTITHQSGMANDFSDVVITDGDNQTLNYYVLEKTDGISMKVRIKQDVGGTANSLARYYVYYDSATDKDYSNVRSNAAGTSLYSYSSAVSSSTTATTGSSGSFTSGNGYLTITDYEISGLEQDDAVPRYEGQYWSDGSGRYAFNPVQIRFINNDDNSNSLGMMMLNTPCSANTRQSVFSNLDGNNVYDSKINGYVNNLNYQSSSTLPFGTNAQLGVRFNYNNDDQDDTCTSSIFNSPTHWARTSPLSFGHSFINVSASVNNHFSGVSYDVDFVIDRSVNQPVTHLSGSYLPGIKFNVIQRTASGSVTRTFVRDHVPPLPTPNVVSDPTTVNPDGSLSLPPKNTNWYHSNYLYRDHIVMGAHDGNNHDNVKMVINHTFNDSLSNLHRDFIDVVITDEDNNVMEYGLKEKSNGQWSTWNVFVPELKPSSGLYVYYGNPFPANVLRIEFNKLVNDSITGNVLPHPVFYALRAREREQGNQIETFQAQNEPLNAVTRLLDTDVNHRWLFDGTDLRIRLQPREIPENFQKGWCEISSGFMEEIIRIAPCIDKQYVKDFKFHFSETAEPVITFRLLNSEGHFIQKNLQLVNFALGDFEYLKELPDNVLFGTDTTYLLKYREHNGRITDVFHTIDGKNQTYQRQGNQILFDSHYPEEDGAVQEVFNFTFDFTSRINPFRYNLTHQLHVIHTQVEIYKDACPNGKHDKVIFDFKDLRRDGTVSGVGKQFSALAYLFNPNNQQNVTSYQRIKNANTLRLCADDVVRGLDVANHTIGLRIIVDGWNDFFLDDVKIMGEYVLDRHPLSSTRVSLYRFKPNESTTDNLYVNSSNVDVVLRDYGDNPLRNYVTRFEALSQEGRFYLVGSEVMDEEGEGILKLAFPDYYYNILISDNKGNHFTSLHDKRIHCVEGTECVLNLRLNPEGTQVYEHRLFNVHYTTPRFKDNRRAGRISYVVADYYSVENNLAPVKNVMIIQQRNQFGEMAEVSRCTSEGISGRLYCNFFRLPHESNPLSVNLYELNPDTNEIIRLSFINYEIPIAGVDSLVNPMTRDYFTIIFMVLAFGFVFASLFNKTLAMISVPASIIIGMAFGLITGEVFGGGTIVIWLVIAIIILTWKLRRIDNE